MTAPKHTDGPWVIAPTDDGEIDVFVDTDEARLIATFQDTGKGGEGEANARLFHASREMLAALQTQLAAKEVEKRVGAGARFTPKDLLLAKDAGAIAKDAIAQATGEGE